MRTGGGLGGEDTGRLDDVVRSDGTPRNVGGISLVEDGDGLALDDELAVLDLDGAVESAVGGVVLEHVNLRNSELSSANTARERSEVAHHVVEVDEGVVDGDDLDLSVLERVSQDNSTNSTEANLPVSVRLPRSDAVLTR